MSYVTSPAPRRSAAATFWLGVLVAAAAAAALVGVATGFVPLLLPGLLLGLAYAVPPGNARLVLRTLASIAAALAALLGGLGLLLMAALDGAKFG